VIPEKPTRPGEQPRCVLLYGEPKIGKSTLCASIPNSLFLATEPGLNHLTAAQIPIINWAAMLSACNAVATEKHEYKTLVIDTADAAVAMCTEHVLSEHGVKHESDLPYGKGWALVSGEWARVILKLAHLPMNLILVSHVKSEDIKARTGDYQRACPSMGRRAIQKVAGVVDYVLYATHDGDRRRILRTKPDREWDAGDRSGVLPAIMPLTAESMQRILGGENDR